MGNILTSWLGWGKKPADENESRNRIRANRDQEDPYPPSRSLSPTVNSSVSSPKNECPPPPRLDSYVEISEQQNATINTESSRTVSASVPAVPEPVLQPSSYEIQLQPQVEKLPTRSEPVAVRIDESPEIELSKKSGVEASPDDEEELLLDDVKPEVEGAVVKIQAGIRGYLTRKSLKEKKKPNEVSTDLLDSDLIGSEDAELIPTVISEVLAENEALLLDENGEENTMGDAATRIQASFRGYKTRQDLKEKYGQDGPIAKGASSKPEIDNQTAAVSAAVAPSFEPSKLATAAAAASVGGLDVKGVVEYGASSELKVQQVAAVVDAVTPSATQPLSSVIPDTPSSVPASPQSIPASPVGKSDPPIPLKPAVIVPSSPLSEKAPELPKTSAITPPPPKPVQDTPQIDASSAKTTSIVDVPLMPQTTPASVTPVQVVSPPNVVPVSIPPSQSSPPPRPPPPTIITTRNQAPPQLPQPVEDEEEYDEEEYTDEEEEAENDSDTINHLVSDGSDTSVPPRPSVPQPIRPASIAPSQVQAAAAQSVVTPTRQPTVAGAPDQSWVTSTVYQSAAGDNHLGDEDMDMGDDDEEEYEEESEEEEEEVDANGIATGIAPTVIPVRPAPGATGSNTTNQSSGPAPRRN